MDLLKDSNVKVTKLSLRQSMAYNCITIPESRGFFQSRNCDIYNDPILGFRDCYFNWKLLLLNSLYLVHRLAGYGTCPADTVGGAWKTVYVSVTARAYMYKTDLHTVLHRSHTVSMYDAVAHCIGLHVCLSVHYVHWLRNPHMCV